MQQQERERIALHLKELEKRFSLDPERITTLEGILGIFQVLAESDRINWIASLRCAGTLEPKRVLGEDEFSEYMDYGMVVVLLGRYKRKRSRPTNKESTRSEKRTKSIAQKILIRPLPIEMDPFPAEREYIHHFPESQVDRGNFKLTFTLRDFVLNAREVQGGSFTFFRHGDGECWFQFCYPNGVIYVDDPNRFHQITIFRCTGSQNPTQWDGKALLTESGRIELRGLVEPGETILVRAESDVRIVFPCGRKSWFKVKCQRSCKFDLDPCLLEYYSREWYPFPYQFFVPDVDHLLNLERMVSGRPAKPMSPNSLIKVSSGWGFHENMERLKVLRRMKVDQSLAHPVPFFSVQNKPLSIVKESDHSLVLYHDDYSLARCTIKPEKRLILLDLIESHSSRVLPFEQIYRYPLY